jgi:RNA polymerase sigma-70 factor, ECF subfamily
MALACAALGRLSNRDGRKSHSPASAIWYGSGCMTSALIQQLLAGLYPAHFRELLAPLIRVSGSFERAEDAVHEAFAQALATWSEQGLPDEPLAWLRQVAKNRVLDGLRRQRTWQVKERQLATQIEVNTQGTDEEADLKDDMLRLIFTCCHPSLSAEAQIALTLRTVCGLTSEQVARSLLLKPTTLQQRIVRAKQKIDLAKIPYAIPDAEQLPERLSAALRTMYLVFNEGYGATEGDSLTRADLCEEAIRLVRLTIGLIPEQFEPQSLLALMLLHHSRRAARTDAGGQLIRLEEQDPTRWDSELIAEALPLVDTVLVARPLSSYAIEAAMACRVDVTVRTIGWLVQQAIQSLRLSRDGSALGAQLPSGAWVLRYHSAQSAPGNACENDIRSVGVWVTECLPRAGAAVARLLA